VFLCMDCDGAAHELLGLPRGGRACRVLKPRPPACRRRTPHGGCGFDDMELPASGSPEAARPERAWRRTAKLKPEGEGRTRVRAAEAETRRDEMQIAARLSEEEQAWERSARRSEAAAVGHVLEVSECATRRPRKENAQARPRRTRGEELGRPAACAAEARRSLAEERPSDEEQHAVLQRCSAWTGDEGQPAGWEELRRGRRRSTGGTFGAEVWLWPQRRTRLSFSTAVAPGLPEPNTPPTAAVALECEV
jgi:hypothetical protein